MILWSITYILVIAYNIKYSISAIPSIAIAANFAWETVALMGDVVQRHSVLDVFNIWFVLDAIIIYTAFAFCRQTKKHPF